jgi:pyruvate kinase
MSISNSADVPTLAGGLIDLSMIIKETDESIRRTKIICTIGPACWEIPQLEILIDAGMNVGEHCFNFLFLC